MNYLVSTFECNIYANEIFHVKALVKYKIKSFEKDAIVFPNDNSQPFILTNQPNQNLLRVKLEKDNYYFLFPQISGGVFVTQFSFTNQNVVITLSNKIFVTIDGKLICEKNVENLKFSHHEIEGDLCLIYFEGVRNFLVIINKDEVCFSDYYDECNINKQEKYFMTKLNDFLNHGRVCHIDNSKFETYLVYLDDDEINLKDQFISFVFLDCVKSKNYLYANSLMCEELRLENAEKIGEFVPEFDWFYPADENQFILIKKNTLAGILKFEVNNKITNVISL